MSKKPSGEVFERYYEDLKTTIRVTVVPLDIERRNFKVVNYARLRDGEQRWTTVKGNIGMKLTDADLDTLVKGGNE